MYYILPLPSLSFSSLLSSSPHCYATLDRDRCTVVVIARPSLSPLFPILQNFFVNHIAIAIERTIMGILYRFRIIVVNVAFEDDRYVEAEWIEASLLYDYVAASVAKMNIQMHDMLEWRVKSDYGPEMSVYLAGDIILKVTKPVSDRITVHRPEIRYSEQSESKCRPSTSRDPTR